MKFVIPSRRAAIDSIAVFQGFVRVPGRKWVYIHPDHNENRLFAIDELPAYFGNLDDMFAAEKEIYKGPLWYHYCRILHLLCKSEGDASVHATAAQRATALFIVLRPPEQEWPSIQVDYELQDDPPDELTETLTGLLKFHGMDSSEAAEAIQKMTTMRPE